MTIPGSLRRYASRIESVDDERGDRNGYWVNLRAGWIDGSSGTHAIHEDTLGACARRFTFVEPCECAECKSVPTVAGAIDTLYEDLSGGRP